ncbi:MAG: stage II sporulation protein M [Gammaproteobacteria bacterium]|nr:stage II sporulation protein M [Gammaproteobacteria bacterium]
MSAQADGARARALTAALLARAPEWQQAQLRALRFARGRSDDVADAVRLADDYRLLAHDLARARALLPASRTRAYLENAYAHAHATLHHGAWRVASTLRRLFVTDIPAAVRSLAPYLLWSTLVFVLAACAGYALVHRYPELIALFASPDTIATVERGQLWTQGLLNVVPSSILSVQILTNNIVVSLFAYCFGFLFGLGTLYILGLNGLMLGAIFAFVGAHGLAGALLRFIIAHGCVELSVMCLSAAAGAAIGEALIRPGAAGRLESFRAAALRTGPVLIACALLLVGSGLIEGFISPDPRFSFASRVVVGVGYWCLMVAFLSGRLFRRRTPAQVRAAR